MHDTRRTRVVLSMLLTVALALIVTDYLGGSAPLRSIGGAVFGTAERAIWSVTGPIAGFFEHGAGAAGSARRVQALERQLIRLRAQLSNEQLTRTDHAQLAKLLRLSGQGGYRIVAANVIAVGQGYEQAVTLDVGSRDGVRPEETVLNASGLVGTVTSVSPWTCTVLLATDATAVAGVRLAGSGQMGWVTGTANSLSGPDLLRLHVLGSSGTVSTGQRLVTSASIDNRPYVPGVPVGAVTQVGIGAGLTGTALVRPFADFTALDVVGVVTPNRPGRGAGG
ncbi:MAG TPA: rod shape-determining protein MreC [Streptosporangiaceae bacterium]